MLVLIQFPIADLRSFRDTEDTRVSAATAFAAAVEAGEAAGADDRAGPFIRNMGPLRKRNQGLRIAGESLYFRGRNGLQFDAGLHAVPDPRGGEPIRLAVLFRRFQAYSDIASGGNVHRLAKYELAWMLDVARPGQAPLDAQQLHALIDSCLTLPVRTAQFDGPKPDHRSTQALVHAGDRIARHLRWFTVVHPDPDHPPPDEWTVRARKPALLVEYGSAEFDGTPSGAAPVGFEAAPNLKLHGRERRVAGEPVQCWYLNSGLPQVRRIAGTSAVEAAYDQEARNLRVAVLRQHAEREVLAHVLLCIAQPGRLAVDEPGAAKAGIPSTPGRALLREYLIRSTALLRRRSRQNRQLPIPGDVDRLGPAALIVDEANPERFRVTGERLVQVLGAPLMSELWDAIAQLPMGELEEDIQIGKLVQRDRPRPLKVAVSYAHEDTGLLNGFNDQTHHDALAGVIERWNDLHIHAGSDWRGDIVRHFSEADVLVLLLTPDFVASEFCMTVEVPLALQLHKAKKTAVLPVEAIECAWQGTPLAGLLQVARPWGKAVVASGNRRVAWRQVRYEVYLAACRLFSERAAAG